jgi:hypothetical protein
MPPPAGACSLFRTHTTGLPFDPSSTLRAGNAPFDWAQDPRQDRRRVANICRPLRGLTARPTTNRPIDALCLLRTGPPTRFACSGQADGMANDKRLQLTEHGPLIMNAIFTIYHSCRHFATACVSPAFRRVRFRGVCTPGVAGRPAVGPSPRAIPCRPASAGLDDYRRRLNPSTSSGQAPRG